jgi:hypothetical protein
MKVVCLEKLRNVVVCNFFIDVVSFRILKSNVYSARYNMRRKEIEYGHM